MTVSKAGSEGVRGTTAGRWARVWWEGGRNFDLSPHGSRGNFHPLVFDLETGNFSLSR